MKAILLAIAIALAAPVAAQVQTSAPLADTQLADPAAEARASALMETLRCVTCQSQSIHDSDAAMAGDMRHQVRARIAAGESPEDVRGWMIARYGDYISYTPRVTALTWPLFAVPALMVLVALLLIWRRVGRRGAVEG